MSKRPLGAVSLVLLALCASCDADDRVDAPEPGAADELASAIAVEPGAAAARRWAPTLNASEVIARGRRSFYPSGTGSFDVGTRHWYARAAGNRIAVAAAPARVGVDAPAALAFHTTFVGRAGADSPEGDFERSADGGVHRSIGEATERVLASDSGVEQSWAFGAQPTGEGDLVVILEVDAGGVDQDADGLLFESELGTIRYGAAHWIDASGETHRIQPEWSGRQIRLTVPRDLIESAEYPAVLDPLIGPEVPTDPVLDAATHDGTIPDVGCVASGCIAYYGAGTAIKFMTFTPDGGLLNPLPVATPYVGSGYKIIDIKPMGANFALIYRKSGIANLQRVAPDGTLLGTALVLGAVPTASEPVAGIACGPTNCLVAWRNGSTGQILGKRLDLAGTDLDPFNFVALSGSPPSTWREVGVAFNGSRFLVGSADGATRVGTDGSVLDLTGIAGLSACGFVASDGTAWLCVGHDSYRIVQDAGTLGQGASFTSEPNAVIWSGSNYLIKKTNFTFTSVSASGTLGSTVAQPDTVNLDTSLAARPGGGAFLGYKYHWGAALQRLDGAGTNVGSRFFANRAGNVQSGSALTAGSGQFLLTWYDERFADYGLYAERLAPDGTPIDAAPILVRAGDVTKTPTSTSAAFNGTRYLVVAAAWGSTSASMDTIELNGNVNTLSSTFSCADFALGAASDGVNFLLSCHDSVQRFSSAGLKIDSSLVPGAGCANSGDTRAGLAFGLGAYLLTTYRAQSSNQAPCYARFSPGGTFVSTGQSYGTGALLPTTHAAAAACTNGVCLMMSGEEMGAFPAAPVQLTSPFSAKDAPSMAGSGAEFAVAYTTKAANSEIMLGRFTAAASPTQIGNWSNVSQTATLSEGAPRVAMLSDGTTLVSYERYVPSIDASRIFVRSITNLPIGDSCTQDGDCASTHCADGVCCNQACVGGCEACTVATGAALNGQCAALPSTYVCRAAVGMCDAVESCDGASTSCPADAALPNADPCDDGNPCTVADACQSGTCSPGAPMDCTPSAECQSGQCSIGTGQCEFSSVPDGAPCSAGQCMGGQCVSSSSSSASSSTGTAGSSSVSGNSSASSGSGASSSVAAGGASVSSTADGSGTSGSGAGGSGSTDGGDGSGACTCRVGGPTTTNTAGFAILALAGIATAGRARQRRARTSTNRGVS